MDAQLVGRFQALLTGHSRIFGTYSRELSTDPARTANKLYGKPTTQFTGVTTALYEEHLMGNTGLGIAPICDDNTCWFGGIDIDVYEDLDHAAMARQIKALALPLVPCRSKSAGCHIYLFASQPVSASAMQGKLREIAALLGHGTTEVFPKQTVLSDNPQAGASWINLPYFAYETGNRYAVTGSGTALTLEQFLDHAESIRVGPEYFGVTASAKADGKKKTKDPLPDGPPCLNHLVQIKFPLGTQDNGMFNFGLYLRKAHPSNWQAQMETASREVFEPAMSGEDVRRIASSIGRTEYKYQCQNEPLRNYCNSKLCRSRKYGVGDGTEVLVFGGLRKLCTVPPVWYWDVEAGGKSGTLELATAELQDPAAVQRKCMEQLTFAPAMPKRNDWIQTLQGALKDCQDMAPMPEDASIEGQFWYLVEGFCTGQVVAFSMDEILMGKPFRDPDGKRTYFRLADLMSYLTRHSFKEYKVNAAAKVLRSRQTELDLQHEPKNLKGKFTNLWSLRSFVTQTEGHPIPASIQQDETAF